MYYRLTYLETRDRQHIGEAMLCSHMVLHIGQTPSCDVEVPDSPDHEPVVSASIVPSGSGDAWLIVRRNDTQAILVNGQQVNNARPLKHGDEIIINDGEEQVKLRFTTHRDGNYDPSTGIVLDKRRSKATHILAIAAAALVLAAIIALVYPRGSHDLRHVDLEPYNTSIYYITTDSVFLQMDTIVGGQPCQVIVQAIELEDARRGTCFLTDDGLFVTARHCIEPWLDDEQWDGVGFNASMSPEVALATRAETANRLSGTTRYSLFSHCVISNGVERYEYHSTDFTMNKSRDLVVCLGTDAEPIYWRTIFPLANRRDMELGDIAHVNSGLTGNIKLATLEELAQFDRQTDKDIAVIGFPINDNDASNVVSRSYGNSQHLELDADTGNPVGCIPMIASINPGNSGGPVVALINGKVKAIGIVSKADSRASQGTFWAVPVTEVSSSHSQDEDLIFRR